jgi:hypothetical protein
MENKFVSMSRGLRRHVLPALLMSTALAARGATTTVFESATNNPAGGTFLASGGDMLVFLGAVTNDGTLRATQGGVLNFFGPVVNRGTVEGVDGSVRFQNTFTNAVTLTGTNILSVKLVPQLYFQNDAGTVARWTLDRFGVFQYAQTIGNTAAWKLKAAGDLDGDGIDDLVWQTASGDTAVWFIDENFGARSTRFLGNTGRWEVRACADSDGDGRAEIFFQEPGGSAAKWFLAADGTFQRAEVIGNTGAWRLQAAAPRIPGYGADLFWQRPGGSVYTWQWRTNAQWNVQHVGEVGDWSLCGSVDMNFDGTGDLIWQMPDGALAAWEMQTNCVPGRIHTWNRTTGWKLRAAGHGRLAVSLNPAVSPAADDAVGQANNWLASGGVVLVNGNGGSAIGATITSSGGLSGGGLVIINCGYNSAIYGALLTNGAPVELTNSLPVTGGSLELTGGSTINFNPTLTGFVLSNGVLLAAHFQGLIQAPITGGPLGGCLFTSTVGTLGSNLVGNVYAGGDGTLVLSGTNGGMVGALTYGSVSHTLDGLTLIPPGDIYTNVTLQLLHGELIGTLSNGVFRVQAP